MNCRSLLVVLALSLPAHACTTDGSGEDTDTEAGDGSSSGTTETTSTSSASASTTSSSGGTDTSGAESSSTGDAETSGSSSGGADASSTGSLGEDVCYGYTVLGQRSEVATDGTAMGQPMCSPKPAPCGGDLVGAWTLEENCGWEAAPNVFAEVCEGAIQQVTGATISGTRTFEDDGTFVFDTVTLVESDVQVDSMACLGADCETFATALSGNGSEMVCEAGEGNVCDCLYTYEIPEMYAGTWEVVMNDVVLTVDGESYRAASYCVENGRLTFWSPLYERTELPDTACSEDADCEGQVEGDYDLLQCAPPPPF